MEPSLALAQPDGTLRRQTGSHVRKGEHVSDEKAIVSIGVSDTSNRALGEDAFITLRHNGLALFGVVAE